VFYLIKIMTTAKGGVLEEISVMEPNAWIHLADPTRDEIQKVAETLLIEPDFLHAALDEEETVRIDTEMDQTLILVDIPVVEPEGTSFMYSTIPLGIIMTENNIVTVCLEETSIIEDFWNNRVRGFDTQKKARFVLQLLYKNASKFLQYLRQIDKLSTQIENSLHKSMKNRELIQMLRLEKSLVYFSTSVKSNEIVLEKMLKNNVIKRYPDDVDLLEDVIVENKQAIEMCTIYRDILSGTMDAFASVISNNLNIVMKFLTSITIVLAIPTMIASFFGMNVKGLPFDDINWGFWAVVAFAAVISGISITILWRKKMF
jgi:magnesium transporter